MSVIQNGLLRLPHFALLAVTLAGVSVVAMAAEPARGKVILVSGNTVGLEFASGDYGMGSQVELSYSTSDGDVISYGHWCIDDIRRNLLAATGEDRKWAITARPVDAQAQPTVGLTATAALLTGPALVQWYKQASAANCRGATVQLARHYKYGRDVPRDRRRSLELLRPLAQSDHYEARWELANLVEDSSMDPSADSARADAARREAFQLRLRLAEEGYVMGYERVGHSYLIGFGTKVDLTRAEKWYRLAEQHKMFKDKEPLVELAYYLEKLYGQPEKAVALLQEGARAGGKKAQAELRQRGLSW